MGKWDQYIVTSPDTVASPSVNNKWDKYAVKDSAVTGEIMSKPTFRRTQRQEAFESGKTLGGVGQFFGGLGGFGLGALAGHPYLGGIAGGTAGRLTGQLMTEQIKNIGESVQKKDLAGLALSVNPITMPLTIKPEAAERITGDIGKTAISESIAAPIGIGLNFAGKGILKGLLGARVAERGFERGFKALLDPEFYKNRVPKMIAEKTSKLFNRLSSTTGEAIETLLKSPKYNNMKVPTAEIKASVANIIPEGAKYKDIYKYIDDIIPPTRPAIEKTLLKQETKKILSMGGAERKLHTLWMQRRKLDKLINSKNWGEEASDYLRKLRTTLNNPIKNAGDDIAKSFHRYAFVKEGEYDLGRNFAAVKSPEGEIYASPAEKFAAELMSTKKDDLIRRLKDLDDLAKADDRIIDKFLDYAAAESLDKKMGFGVWQEMLVGMLGGRKRMAELGAIAQEPVTKGLKQAIGRSVPVMATDLMTGDN